MTETLSLLDWVRKTPLPFSAFEEVLALTQDSFFDWEALSSQLAHNLQLPSLSIEPSRCERRPREFFKEGLGEEPWILTFQVAPLPGYAFWLMSKADLEKWLSWVWKEEPFLTSPLLQEGFYRYMALECVNHVQQLDAFSHYTLSLSEEGSLPEGDAIVMDLGLHCHNRTAWGRLILSTELLSRWQKSQKQPPHAFPLEKAQSLFLSASLLRGFFTMPWKEIKALKQGDIVLIESNATPCLTVGYIPFFQVNLQNSKVQLTNYAHQENEFMGKKERASDEEAITLLKDVPLTVSIELAKLRLSLHEVLQLAPGTTLDLAIEPHQSVALILNGQKIGSGELVTLGDVIGVRILELGKTGKS